MSDYPMLISNKLHSFRNFNFANILNCSHIVSTQAYIKLYFWAKITIMIRKTEYQLEIILKIKELREANNVSQKELSNLLEVAPGLIGSIESPKFPHKYTLSQIYKICHYFNITIEQLFISEEDFSKDRDIIDLLIFNIIRYGE